MKKYQVYYTDAQRKRRYVSVFSMDANMAERQFRNNYPGARDVSVKFDRMATEEEVEQICNTGAPHPRHKKS